MHRAVHFDGITSATCPSATTIAIDAPNNAPKRTRAACKRSKYSPQVVSRRARKCTRCTRTALSPRKHGTSIRFGHARNTGGIVATDSVSRCNEDLVESI